VTQRQFLAWGAWLDLQWNEPDRSDHYLMALRAEMQRGYAKDPRSVPKELDAFKIKFKEQTGSKTSGMTLETFCKLGKAQWMAFCAFPRKRRDGKGGRALPVTHL
jgi:hypothetical protein